MLHGLSNGVALKSAPSIWLMRSTDCGRESAVSARALPRLTRNVTTSRLLMPSQVASKTANQIYLYAFKALYYLQHSKALLTLIFTYSITLITY